MDKENSGKKIAVIRVRGLVNVNQDVKDTLNMLHLFKRNFCVLIPSNPIYLGMLQKVKDQVTWGDVDDKALALLEKRKEEGKKFFRLQPPKKGYGRKGVKQPFSVGGALGDRGEKINDLIERMV